MLLRTLYYFYGLKRNLSLSLSYLQEIQRKSLRRIVRHAYENVLLYHRKFDQAGVKPGDTRAVGDLSKIPVTTKAEIQSSPLSDVLASGVEADGCVHVQTSGSTGSPLDVYLGRSAADYRFALMSRPFWEDGIRPWYRMAMITIPSASRGYSTPKYRGLARRLHISMFDDVDKQLSILTEYRPDFLESYPSSLLSLAHACLERGINIRPKLILTGAELLLAGDAEAIRSVFGCDSMDGYGCLEIGPLAWECREHAGYHMNVDGVVMEFLDKNGKQVAAGERGEITCTSLVNYSMQFIRYLIDDQGIPSYEECPCGRPLPLMKMVEGRKDDFLTAMDGRIVSPLVFCYMLHLGYHQGLSQFRVIQEARDRLTIQLAGLKAQLDEKTADDVRSRIREILGEGMQIEFQLVDTLERDAGGKLRKVISHVPLKWDA
jgi:phenylacetate-CoA ligase